MGARNSMKHKITLFAAATAATLAIAIATTAPSNAQAPAAQPQTPAARPGRGGNAADSAAPARRQGEGTGPFKRLVIRSVTLIDGTGGPPLSPMDIVIEGNRIAAVRQAGWPGLPQQPNREPRDADFEIDGKGMYVLPGFVDMHVHGSGRDKAPDLSYSYKLWLAHGVTTVRGVSLASAALASSEKDRSARNEIAAPRIFNYQTLGSGWPSGPVNSPDKAREWVRWAAANNIDGIKFFNRGDETPEIIAAAIDEAHKNKMGTVAHLSQNGVANFNARNAGDAHLDTVTHYYGHMESLLKDKTIQEFPVGYDYNNEQDRFGDIARIWNQTYEPGSPQWMEYLEHQKANKVTFDPTFNIYAASRDLMRARNADWHQTYTMPQLWNYFQSTRDNHGSYFYDWTSENEYHWKMFYQRYMRLIGDYKNIGGRVTVGTDSGFIWKTYGFAYIEELELLREAGFLPLEIMRSATMWGARTLYEPRGETPPMGVVRAGMLADLVIVGENPLANLKVLYGTGHMRLNPQTNRQERVGGVKYTIKDGIVYDAQKLLAEVAAAVAAEKRTVTMTTSQR
jgi:imidazolonepropionase-like amidohydrolase